MKIEGRGVENYTGGNSVIYCVRDSQLGWSEPLIVFGVANACFRHAVIECLIRTLHDSAAMDQCKTITLH